MVSTLFSTLDTRLPSDEESGEAIAVPARPAVGEGDAPDVQPVQVILRWLIPVLKVVVERWASDEHIMTVSDCSITLTVCSFKLQLIFSHFISTLFFLL